MRRLAAAVSVLAIAVASSGVISARQSRAAASRTTLQQILAIEDDRASTSADLDVLIQALRGPLANNAIRALGRLERRDVITDLLPYLAAEPTRAAAATAVSLALRGRELDGVPRGQQEHAVINALIAAGDLEMVAVNPVALTPIARALGRVPVEEVQSFKAVESFLRKVLEKPFPRLGDEPHIGAARGLESLVRLRRKIASLDEDTIDALRDVAETVEPRRADHQRNALAALVAAQAVDVGTLSVTLSSAADEVRRLAMLSLAGAAAAVENEDRVPLIRKALSDPSPMVRLEAVRAWVRRGVATEGCQPILDALADKSAHVVHASLDALGDVCKDDESITIRLAAETRTPKPQGDWQREMHAFVALAKRDRERARVGLLALAMHQTWQVRMYAARVAALLDDTAVLTRLATDTEANVAEATLAPLRRLTGSGSDGVFVEALNRRTRAAGRGQQARPYELIRTAANALENATSSPALVNAIASALERISAEQCETSRDTRLALIARLGQLGSSAQVPSLMPLIKDIDPKVAQAAADVLAGWTGKIAEIETPPQRSSAIPGASELASAVRVSFEMARGGRFDLTLAPESTPLTRARFLAAARAGYYNNLTFHRVVPNFVIQGGSPGANEYCGECPFMRDEVGAMHVRGTVGISTRGPDTGDAQIFINLVDNMRLDFDYTAFAHVCSGMDVVDDIQEGDRIVRVQVLPPDEGCGK